MPTMCIQCAMRAMLDGVASPVFEEEPVDHMLRVHPDRVATQRERDEMERELAARIAAGWTPGQLWPRGGDRG